MDKVNEVCNFPVNTCPASRHVARMAKALDKGEPYPMLQEEPEHCAESMAATVQALWQARQKLIDLGYEWRVENGETIWVLRDK